MMNGLISLEQFSGGKSAATTIFLSPSAAQLLSQLEITAKNRVIDFLLSMPAPAMPTLSKDAVKPRSKLFRALGTQEPPIYLEIKQQQYQLLEIYKHDSWAATAIYVGKNHKIVCKFNRQQPIFGIPMRWLGRWLAQRENRFLQLFADLPNIPPYCGEVTQNGTPLPYVSAHTYIEGIPLRRYPHPVSDNFFPQLQQVLQTIHAQQISYMDLNKRENILVTTDGKPCLIDFQICFHLPKRWPGNCAVTRYLLRLLQQSDNFHLMKHYTRLRPDLFTPQALQRAQQRPWFLNLYRCVQIPLRTLRRRLLTMLGFRNKSGKVTSEVFVEHGMRGEADGAVKIQVGEYQLLFKKNPSCHGVELVIITSNV
jgi:hypothetical protein